MYYFIRYLIYLIQCSNYVITDYEHCTYILPDLVTVLVMRVSILYQVKDEAMVEDLNMILNLGDVPNLYAADEKAEILEKMQGIAKDMVSSPRSVVFRLVLTSMGCCEMLGKLHIVGC